MTFVCFEEMLMKRMLLSLCLLTATTLSGCIIIADDNNEPDPTDPWTTDISKKDAADLMKADPANTPDYCQTQGWYGDGVCDDFCYEEDSDCGTVEGCSDSRDCPTDQFCGTAAGQCGGQGSCQIAPEVCTEEYAPVCGCDGQTYSNACFASASGASVAHEGPCEMPPPPECVPEDCGPALGAPSMVCADGTTAGPVCERLADGTCGWNYTECPAEKSCGGEVPDGVDNTCDPGQYCHYEEADICGFADAPGVCRARPEACDLLYAPVCGCDEQTYGNACEANASGTSVQYEGECEVPTERSCGGNTPDGPATCNSGEYCHYELEAYCGFADATGTCQPLPEACTEEYAPVCGCDDKTYGNACTANSAGVSVQYIGECEGPAPTTCGGFAGETCGPDEFCKYDERDMCGAADQQGTCEPKPDACPDIYMPVCGCDGMTYGNGCEANSAGVSIASQGACGGAVPPDSCGGFAGVQCPAGEFCKYDEQAMCGFADATGTCEPQPQACPQNYAPVCGCDGQTYSNSCIANSAGVSVQHNGECGSNGGNACGGFAGLTCGTNEYCFYEVSAMCGAADQQGICKPKPQSCHTVNHPVCACDGQTYANECHAATSGYSVMSTGACAP